MVRTNVKEDKESEEEIRNWSELQRDVLSVIARRLTVGTDRVRFSEVCRNWSSVAKSENNYFPCCPPWLMLYDKFDASSLPIFVSAGGLQRFELDFPEIRQRVGSSGCWLVMDLVDRASNLYLLNPLSRAKIDLPNVCVYDKDGEYPEADPIFLFDFRAQKVVFSFLNSDSDSGSGSNFDFVAMVIFDKGELAYFRKGANLWQVVESPYPECSFVDILFFKGEFYALDSRGILFKCLIGSPHKLVQVSDELEEIYCEVDYYQIEKRYLVPLFPRIVQVVKIFVWYDEDATMEFRVFRKINEHWVEIGSLGAYSLFLGPNTSVAISARSSINLKRNCIYFSQFGNVDIYDLSDSTVVTHYTGFCSVRPFAPISPFPWMVPTSLSVGSTAENPIILD